MAFDRWRRAKLEEHARLLERGTDDHYLDAELYDFEYSDRLDDVQWYQGLAEELAPPMPIVELGAGTGRICIPLAHDGFEVVALDRMPAMLQRLEHRLCEASVQSRVRPLLADMTDIPLPEGSHALVIAPFNALMHLYRWQDLLACFRQVHRVLRPGGTFAFDVQLPDLEWLLWDPDERHAVTPFVHPRTGESLVYSTNHTYDAESQVCHVRIYYDDAPPVGETFDPPAEPRRVVHLAHRQIFPEELRLLVDAAGFELVEHTGDFDGVPLTQAVESQVVICRKPGRERDSGTREPPPP